MIEAIPKERMPEGKRKYFKWFSLYTCTVREKVVSRYDSSIFHRDVATICPRCEGRIPLMGHNNHDTCPHCNLAITVLGTVLETIDWENVQ